MSHLLHAVDMTTIAALTMLMFPHAVHPVCSRVFPHDVCAAKAGSGKWCAYVSVTMYVSKWIVLCLLYLLDYTCMEFGRWLFGIVLSS